jgi:hypothetical protein
MRRGCGPQAQATPPFGNPSSARRASRYGGGTPRRDPWTVLRSTRRRHRPGSDGHPLWAATRSLLPAPLEAFPEPPGPRPRSHARTVCRESRPLRRHSPASLTESNDVCHVTSVARSKANSGPVDDSEPAAADADASQLHRGTGGVGRQQHRRLARPHRRPHLGTGGARALRTQSPSDPPLRWSARDRPATRAAGARAPSPAGQRGRRGWPARPTRAPETGRLPRQPERDNATRQLSVRGRGDP